MTLRILLLSFLLLFNVACKSKHKAMPAKPMDRMDVIALHLPDTAESLVVIPEIKVFREKAKLLKQNLGDSGVLERVQKQFRKSFGIDLLDEKSWVNAGLTPNSSVGLAIFRDRPVAYLYVDNRQKFEKSIINAMEHAFQFKGVPKNTKVGEYQIKLLNDDPGKQLAWLYDEKLVMISMPSLSKTGALKSGAAGLVLTAARGVKAEASFKNLAAFSKFKDRFASKYPIAAIVPVENYLKNPDVQKRIKAQQNGKEAEALIRKYAEYFVVVADVKGQRISTDIFVGGNDQFNSVVKTLAEMKVSGEWDAFVTENLGLGIRLAIDPVNLYSFLAAVMPEKDVRQMKRTMKRTGDQFGIDIEKDLLANLTGQIGVFFYGVKGSPLALAQGDINSIISKLGLMVSLQFKDQKGAETLLSKLIQHPEAKFAINDAKANNGEVLDGMKSITLPLALPVRTLIYKNRLLIATPALDEEAIYGYLSGTRKKDKRIADVKGFDLGAEFASTKAYNGIYANLHRLKSNPGQILGMIGAGVLIESFEEIKLVVSPDKDGIKISLVADANKIESAPAEKK